MKSKLVLSLCVLASAQNFITAKDDHQTQITPISKPEAPALKKPAIKDTQTETTPASKPENPAQKKSIKDIITNDITTATALAAALRNNGYTADANQLDVLKNMTLPKLINAIKSQKHGLSPELAQIIKNRNEGKSASELLKALTAFKK